VRIVYFNPEILASPKDQLRTDSFQEEEGMFLYLINSLRLRNSVVINWE
jgi:hypothetical protein